MACTPAHHLPTCSGRSNPTLLLRPDLRCTALRRCLAAIACCPCQFAAGHHPACTPTLVACPPRSVVVGYRAPYFFVNNYTGQALAELGFL